MKQYLIGDAEEAAYPYNKNHRLAEETVMTPQVKPWRVAGCNKYVNCGAVAIVKKLSPLAASIVLSQTLYYNRQYLILTSKLTYFD